MFCLIHYEASGRSKDQPQPPHMDSHLIPHRALFIFLYIYVSFLFCVLSSSAPPSIFMHMGEMRRLVPSFSASPLYRAFTGPRKHVLIFNAALSGAGSFGAKLRGLCLSVTGKVRQRMILITKVVVKPTLSPHATVRPLSRMTAAWCEEQVFIWEESFPFTANRGHIIAWCLIKERNCIICVYHDVLMRMYWSSLCFQMCSK